MTGFFYITLTSFYFHEARQPRERTGPREVRLPVLLAEIKYFCVLLLSAVPCRNAIVHVAVKVLIVVREIIAEYAYSRDDRAAGCNYCCCDQ